MIDAKNIVNALTKSETHVVKTGETCAVVEDASHFWKIAKVNEANFAYRFDVIVKQTFAEVHREIGIDWEVFFERDDDGLFLVEKREKLKTCDNHDMSLEDCLRQSAKITRCVEEKLEMRLLLAQIRQNEAFRNIRKIKLARDREDAIDDFAIHEGSVVILGDTGWFLALVNADGKWENALFSDAVEVNLTFGDFFFANQEVFNEADQAIASIYDMTQRWWLFPKDEADILATRDHLKHELETMMKTNAKILTNKQSVPVKDQTSYFSFQEESVKLLGGGADE